MLSFILPSYNVAPYIERAVNSILDQHLSDYEIIIVDDGSRDNLVEVCQQWKENERVIVVSTGNQGVSEARNEGLKRAKGEYVCFLDPDDWYEKDVMASALEAIKRDGADALRFGYNKVYESEELKRGDDPVEDLINDEYLCEGDAILTKLVSAYIGFSIKELMHLNVSNFRKNKRLSFVWSYIFKRQILIDNSITFAKGLHFMEDKLFLCEYLCHTQKVILYDKVCYNYYVRKDGLRMTNTADCLHHAEQRVLAEQCRSEMAERVKSTLNIDIKPLYRGTLIMASLQMLAHCFSSPSLAQFKLFMKYLHCILTA